MPITADRRNQTGKVGAGVPPGSAVTKEPAQNSSQAVGVRAFSEQLLYEVLDRGGLESLEPLPLSASAHRFKQGTDVDATSFDRLLRELAIYPEITEVGQQEPVEGCDKPFWLWRCQGFDLDQVIEEKFERTPHCSSGGIATN
jgi:hypothetical protein